MCLPAPGGQEEERSLEVFAGSSSAAGCLGFAAAKTNLPRSASALLSLRSVQLSEGAGSLRERQPEEVRSDGGQTELPPETAEAKTAKIDFTSL